MVAKAGEVPILYSLTLGMVEFTVLHELAHVYRRDVLALEESNTTSISGIYGGPDPAVVSYELAADEIALDMAEKIKDVTSKESFAGHSFYLLAFEALRFTLVTLVEQLPAEKDGCELYRQFCLSTKSHPPYFQRVTIAAGILLANEINDDEPARRAANIVALMERQTHSGECSVSSTSNRTGPH